MPETPAISCLGVRKAYSTAAGTVEALRHADAAFPAGAVSALVGPSGSGKSTLLRLVAGTDGADAGSIEVGGVAVSTLHGAALRRYRRDVSTFVAQRATANLVPHLRLRDHLPPGRGVELLVHVGLGDRVDARAAQLSGGEQARAALALALARGTPVVLFDEPTAELDRAATGQVIELLLEAAADGRTIVVGTHDRDLIDIAETVVDLAGPRRATRDGDRAGARVAKGAGLAVRGLVKRYGTRVAVDDVSLELPPGEIGVILGRSGSGKSTLLMALGGWITPDQGDTGVADTSWACVGYLPQRFGLLPELSVEENLGLPLRIAGLDWRAPVAAVLDELALADLAGRPPLETSIGQQQRAALGRALVQRPALLLADEPTSHQDAGSADLVWQAIRRARADGTACLVASHDPGSADHADRVWEMVDGRLQRRR